VPAESPPAPPEGLAAFQADFAQAMCAPIDIYNDAGDFTLAQDRYPAGLVERVLPRGGSPPQDRLAIYNRQYWFRLLTVLQEEYPLLRHWLGLVEFNRMAVAYLDAHPSTSPTLRELSDHLVAFLGGGDHRWAREDLRQGARLGHLFIRAFDAATLPPLDAAAAGDALLTAPLTLQPHWALFVEDWDLVACRRRARAAEDDATVITPTPVRGYWAIYRGGGGLSAEPLDAHQHALLSRLAAGEPFGAACEALAAGLAPDALAAVQGAIGGWFARWMSLGWFAQPPTGPR